MKVKLFKENGEKISIKDLGSGNKPLVVELPLVAKDVHLDGRWKFNEHSNEELAGILLELAVDMAIDEDYEIELIDLDLRWGSNCQVEIFTDILLAASDLLTSNRPNFDRSELYEKAFNIKVVDNVGISKLKVCPDRSIIDEDQGKNPEFVCCHLRTYRNLLLENSQNIDSSEEPFHYLEFPYTYVIRLLSEAVERLGGLG